MTPDREQQVEDLFHSAIERAPGRRRSFLAKACKGDPALRKEVESLLLALADTDGFLEQPPCGALTADSTTVDGISRPENDGESMAGRRIGAWRLIRKIAEGGMGAVYLAGRADGHFEQEVAIKLIRRGIDSDDQAQRSKIISRFRDELQHHANLDHPNVAKLFDGGTTTDGTPYLVMEYVQGRPIDEYCQTHDIATAERLKLFRTVCLAVQHAHNRFVAHCDLKPSNIIVAREQGPDGVPTPKLLDFGIAKLLEEGRPGRPKAAKITGIRALTPQYASPEQVRDETITAASDIYSLGVVLYELITGQLPYDVTEYDAKQVICEQIPKNPCAIAPQTDREVAAIMLKALEKTPADRYASPAALAEDIDRYLTGRPILAHGDSLPYSLKKFVIRRRSQIASGFLITALITVGLAVGVWIGKLSGESERQIVQAERSNTINRLDALGRDLRSEAIAILARAEGSDGRDREEAEAEAKFLDARFCLRQVLDMEQDTPPGSVPRSRWLTAETTRLLGHCLIQLREYDQAEPLLLRSYSVIHSHFGNRDTRTQETGRWIIEMYEAWGKPDESLAYQNELQAAQTEE